MVNPHKSVIADSLGVGIGVGTYGITFGALATASGLSVWQTCLLSLLAFTGASQFTFIGVLASGGTPITAAVSGILLGTRNMFYSITLANLLRPRGLRKFTTAHLVIDESTAMALAQKEPESARVAFWWTGASIFIMWNLMTFLGAIAGTNIADPKALGLDAAVAAAFLGLVWPRLTDKFSRLIALFAVLCAVVLIPITMPGMPIILGGGAAVALGLVLTRNRELPGAAR